MPGPGDDDDERTLPDAKAPRVVRETFDDDGPLGFVPPNPKPSAPKSSPRSSLVPLLLRGLAPPRASTPKTAPPLAAPALVEEPRGPAEGGTSESEEIELDEDAIVDVDEVVREWARSLDRIDYLSLLNLPQDEEPSDERVREGWRSFALAFHPDRHRDAPEDVWAATTQVFQRGAEAYRVLHDPTLRRRYLELMASEGTLRLSPRQVEQARQEGDGSSARDVVHSPAARAFAEKGDELLAAGKLEAARLQFQLALMREAGNERLAHLLRQLELRIVASRPMR